jgi:uncharacterized integral membrane protein
MEALALSVGLGALAVSVCAWIRTTPCRACGHRTVLGHVLAERLAAALTDDSASDQPLVTPGVQRPCLDDLTEHHMAIVRPVRSGERRSPLTGDWWLRVIPGACLAGAVAIIVTAFALQNTQQVSITLLDWHFPHVPLAAAILISSFVVGVVVGGLAVAERARLRARIDALEYRLRSADRLRRHPSRYGRSGRPGLGYSPQLPDRPVEPA